MLTIIIKRVADDLMIQSLVSLYNPYLSMTEIKNNQAALVDYIIAKRIQGEKSLYLVKWKGRRHC